MSTKHTRKKQKASSYKAKTTAKKQAKLFAMQRNITIVALLVLLVVGLISTTFATYNTELTPETGSLIADIKSAIVKNKEDLADTKANVDITTTAADRTFVANERFYIKNFKASGMNDPWITSNGTAWIHLWNKSNSSIASVDIEFKHLSGTKGAIDAIYYVEIPASSAGITYDYFIITRNSSGATGPWNNKWNQTGDMQMPSHRSNMITGGMTDGGTGRSYDWYAETPTSVTATVTNAVSGTGTSSNPYIVRPGASYTVKLTASKPNPGNEGYGYNINSSSTSSRVSSTSNTYSYSYTAGTTEGTSTTYTGYAWAYDEHGTDGTKYYSSSYKTSSTIYVKVEKEKFSYTISAATGGTVSPSGSGSASAGVSVTATPSANYTFDHWDYANGTVSSSTSATTTFTPTTNGATLKAIFLPNAPTALTLTGSNVATGTNGTGTSANPYIVFKNGGFTLTANATVPSGSTAYYCTTSNGSYSTTKTFSPATTTTGTSQSYTVYAKSFANNLFSTNYISSTAYYMAFTHLSDATTGFTLSSDSITDAESVTLSGAYINGVADAEKDYITQSYQISSDNVTFADLTGNSWTPDAVGAYYFRVKTTNTKTGEVVYSSSQRVTVEKSTVYYNITLVKASGSGSADGTFKTNGTTITDNKILSNEPLTIAVKRTNNTPSNYYFTYIKVTDGTNSWNIENLNVDLTDTLVIDHVKGDVTIEYHTSVKPLVQPGIPTNAASISFKYFSDGVEKTGTTAGNYYVDYNSNISYSVTPKTGYYVSSMTGVTMGAITSSTVTGTKNNIIANVGTVTATLTANKTITVNIDKDASDETDGASMTVDGSAVAFGTGKPLNYGAEAEVVITPPENCYAVVSGENVVSEITTDGKATFKVTLTGANKTYTVKFVANPKIYMVQPQYGSIYVTDTSGKYYFNGDPVGYGSELIVNVLPDHINAKLSNVLVNNASIGTADGSAFIIYEDSTATATITVSSDFSFTDNTEYGTRRIFFTDNAGWGNSNSSNVLVYYSNKINDNDFTSNNNIAMTRKYKNDYGQYVYYADIPFSAKYVTFVNKANTTQYSQQGTIVNSNNAYYIDSSGNYPRAIHTWTYNYSDYIATDRADSIQQAVTSKGQAATFQYTCDFGDGALSAEAVAGNEITYDFDRGILSITPTQSDFDYSLVKVTSAASGSVKYYLIKVDNFEIASFEGLQKIYSTSVFNEVQLELLLKGGVLNYAAKYWVSDSNINGSFKALEGVSSGFEKVDSLEGYINSFLIEYAINSISGVKYYKVDATDGSGKTATKTLKTLFGTNTYMGERCLYFYNDTNVNISKYNLRACFFDAGGGYVWSTMQRVGNTDYYRATVPTGYESKVNFYLCNKNTYSTDITYFDGVDDTTDYYTFGVSDVAVPKTDEANIVFVVSSINSTNGIEGEFADFDY